MTRRAALAGLVSGVASAALTRSEVLDAVAPLASALSQGDADAFIAALVPGSPDRDKLRPMVKALTDATEITCSVEVTDITQDGAQLDWLLQLSSKSSQTVVERRRGRVTVRLTKNRVASLSPLEFFAPPKPGSL